MDLGGIAFYVVAVVTLAASLGVVTSRSVVYSALLLVAALMLTGLIYLFLLADFLALNVPLIPTRSLVQSALQLSPQHQRTVYDALYLVLAQERNCDLITADERFFNALSAQFPQLQLLRHWQPPTAE